MSQIETSSRLVNFGSIPHDYLNVSEQLLTERTILNSIKKTGRLVIISKEPVTASAAGEIAAIAADKGFLFPKSPVKRVCAPDMIVPFSPILEKSWIPGENVSPHEILPTIGTTAKTSV